MYVYQIFLTCFFLLTTTTSLAAQSRTPQKTEAPTETAREQAREPSGDGTIDARVLYQSAVHGNPAEALAAIDEQIRLNGPTAQLLWLRGEALTRSDRFGEAIEAYSQSIDTNPSQVESYNGCAMAYWKIADAAKRAGDKELAFINYRNIFVNVDKMEPGNNRSLLLGLASQNTGKYRDALAHYSELLSVLTDDVERANVYSLRAETLESLSAIDLSVEDQMAALELVPSSHRRFSLLRNLNALKRYEEVLPHVDRLLTEDPLDVNLRINRAGVLVDMEEFAEAESELMAVKADNPDDRALSDRVDSLVQFLQKKKAGIDEEAPITAEPQLGEIRELMNQNAFEKAKELAYQSWQANPGSAELALACADAALAADDFDYMIMMYSWAIRNGDSSAHVKRAEGLSKFRLASLSVVDLELACQDQPTAELFRLKAVALISAQRHEDALVACDRSQELGGDRLVLHGHRAVAFSRLENHLDAIAELDSAIKLDGNNIDLLAVRAEQKWKLGDYLNAKQDFVKMLSLTSDKNEFQAELQNAIAVMNSYSEAQQVMRRFLEIQSEEDAERVGREFLAPLDVCQRVFKSAFAEIVAREYTKAAEQGAFTLEVSPEQSVILIESFTSDSIISGHAKNAAGGWKNVADQLLPGVTFYRVQFVKTGNKLGYSVEGLVKIDDHWYLFPKPWRLSEGR